MGDRARADPDPPHKWRLVVALSEEPGPDHDVGAERLRDGDLPRAADHRDDPRARCEFRYGAGGTEECRWRSAGRNQETLALLTDGVGQFVPWNIRTRCAQQLVALEHGAGVHVRGTAEPLQEWLQVGQVLFCQQASQRGSLRKHAGEGQCIFTGAREFGTGIGADAITGGPEVTWSQTPTQWSNHLPC